MGVNCRQRRQIFIVESLKTTVAPLNWLPVSRIPRCVRARATSTPSIIISVTKFKTEQFPFIQFLQLKCLLIYSPRFAMKRLTQGWGSNWWGGNLQRQASSSEWGSKGKYWLSVHCHTVLRSYSTSPSAWLLNFSMRTPKCSEFSSVPKWWRHNFRGSHFPLSNDQTTSAELWRAPQTPFHVATSHHLHLHLWIRVLTAVLPRITQESVHLHRFLHKENQEPNWNQYNSTRFYRTTKLELVQLYRLLRKPKFGFVHFDLHFNLLTISYQRILASPRFN